MTRRPVIVLVSGGLDSCVTVALAAREHDVALLHCTYGQRTASRERAAFEAIARHFDARATRIVDLSHLGRLGGSSLTDPARPVETGTSEPGVIPSTYVPFRNTHLLSVAVSWAEVAGIRKIYIGAVESDSAGYPDCRAAYYEAFNRLIRVGTREGAIEVVAPLIDRGKGEIVRLGRELDAPLHLTWSCYVRGDIGCGRCESCTLRRCGFEEAGVEDPVPTARGEEA